MKKSLGRAVALASAAFGAVAAPTPAAAYHDNIMECYAACYQAYYVITFQPTFYEMCKRRCLEMYGDDLNGMSSEMPLGVIRYD